MAPNQPEGFNRRQLLGSAAGLVTAGIAPGIDQARRGAVPAEVADLRNPEPIPPSLNVCAVTARRLAEIAARNRIREEAGLPLLSMPRELRRMKQAADEVEFETFAAVHSAAVWDEVLAPERNKRGQPDWRPMSLMEGLRFQSLVSRLLHQRFALEAT